MKTYIKNFFNNNPNLAFFIIGIFITTIYTLVYYSIGDREVIFSFILLFILLKYISYLFLFGYIIHILNNCLYISYYFNLFKIKIFKNNKYSKIFDVILIILGVFIFFLMFLFFFNNVELIPTAYAEEPYDSIEELEELLRQEVRAYNIKNSIFLNKRNQILDLFYRHTSGVETSISTGKT